MKQKLLAVMPESTNYNCCYALIVVQSFQEAKERIAAAEQQCAPIDTLDLPIRDMDAFWEFLHWMRSTGRNYPFSVFGNISTPDFWALCEKCRGMGFHFNT